MNNVFYRLIRILDDGQCQLERKSDLSLSTYSKQELLGLIATGSLVFGHSEYQTVVPDQKSRIQSDLASCSEDQQQQALYRLKYVQKAEELLGKKVICQGLYRVIKLVAEENDHKKSPSVISVYRWWKRWTKSGYSILALIDRKRGAKHKRRIIHALETVVQQIIEEIYLKQEGGSIQDVFDKVETNVKLLNVSRNTPLIIPSRATVYRYLATYDLYLVMEARKGKQAAERHFRATGKGPEPKYILERVEVDHTPLDLLIVDGVTGLTLGRPTVTFFLDRYTRMPLGFEIGFEPPSELAVIRALRHAIMPKHYVEKDYPDVENRWLAYGIIITLVCDNGLEFHSHQLRRICAELNIELVFCPKKQPHYKGAIERFLGTFNRQLSHKIAGTTFSNIESRGDYDSEKEAFMTLAELKRLVHVWIIDVYTQTPHKGLDTTPALAWSEGLKTVEPLLPESKEQLDLILAKQTNRKLNHEGVQYERLFYNSAELATLRHRGIESVDIRVNVEDLGAIWVFDKQHGDYLTVPCTYPEYANGLSLAQHLLIRRYEQETKSGQVDVTVYQRGKDKLRSLINAAKTSKKQSQRKKAARYDSDGLKQTPFSANSLNSKVETLPDDLGQVIDIPDFDTENRENPRD